MDVSLTWPGGTGGPATGGQPAAVDLGWRPESAEERAAPEAGTRRAIRFRVGENPSMTALRSELAALRSEVDALRAELADLRSELASGRSAP